MTVRAEEPAVYVSRAHKTVSEIENKSSALDELAADVFTVLEQEH
jgi:hypothetical protein